MLLRIACVDSHTYMLHTSYTYILNMTVTRFRYLHWQLSDYLLLLLPYIPLAATMTTVLFSFGLLLYQVSQLHLLFVFLSVSLFKSETGKLSVVKAVAYLIQLLRWLAYFLHIFVKLLFLPIKINKKFFYALN